MLKSVTNFWSNKSIKLSDAFEVLITDKVGKEPKLLVNCTGFTIPKLEYDEEVLSYGNLSQVFQTPKYDSCKELTLDFIELMDKSKHSLREKHQVVLSKIFEYMGFEVSQIFMNSQLAKNTATYSTKIIPTLDIKILNNNLWRYKFKYHFDNLKVVNYTIYNLDYQSDSPCKVTVTLSFETYYRQAIDEPVNYGENTKTKTKKQKEALYNPNGKAKADTIFMDGDSKAHKDDIEQNWRESVNQSDLDMISNEQLYKPSYEPLPDLDDEVIEPELHTAMYKYEANESDLDMIRNPDLGLEDL